MPGNWKDLFIDYFHYLTTIIENNHQLRYSTIYQRLSMIGALVNKYYKTKEGKKEHKPVVIKPLPVVFIQQTLETLVRQKKVFDYYKKFLEFANTKNYFTEQYCQEISSLDLKKRITTKLVNPENLKKWSIPETRYPELFGKIKTDIVSFIVYIGLQFGLRAAELLYLEEEQFVWEKTDYAEGFLTIKSKQIAEDLIFEPKTDNSIRKLPIQKDQKREIEAYFEKIRDYLKDAFTVRPHSYVIFSTRTNKNVTYSTFYNWLKKITVPFTEEGKTFNRVLRPHVLRYSFAVNFYRKSNDLLATSKMLGHQDLVTTEIYLNLTKEQIFLELSKVTKKLTALAPFSIDLKEIYLEQTRRIQDLKVLRSVKEFKENEIFVIAVDKLEYMTKQLLKLL